VRRVEGALKRADKGALITFLRARFHERYFQPIRRLQGLPKNEDGVGFAIMSLASLLIEGIQSFVDGLPSNNKGELKRLHESTLSPDLVVPEDQWPVDNGIVFSRFFSHRLFASRFPNVESGVFYGSIRNGLLHQAQTKQGWRILREGKLWDARNKSVNRRLFGSALEDAFETFLSDLSNKNFTDHEWALVRRKLWWLIKLSK
jgi:hypothetical protein